MNVRALNANVVIIPDAVSEVTPGGIVLPNDDDKPETGTVVSIGPKVENQYLKGAKVVFNPYDADNFLIEDKEYFVFEERKLLARLD